ncbi:MAG: FtsH protease activity modulator HflK [Alphaproteobacteria bacterium]
MAGENQGNPWGSPGGKRPSGGNPWTQPGGNGQRPPSDLEGLKKAAVSFFNDFMGGHIGGGKVFTIFGLMLLLIWSASGLFQINSAQLGIVMRFGDARNVVGPGLHYHLPYPLEDVIVAEVTSARKIEVGYRSGDARDPEESMMLTSDENIIDVNFDVLWQVDPARVKDYVFNIKDPPLTVKAVAESAMREVIGQSNIQTAITSGRDAIERKTTDLMQKTLDQYQTGIEITQVNLRGAMPPPEVNDAFQDVTRARSDKETKINQAETYHNNIVPEAEGQAAKMLQEASAYKEQIVNQAHGNAERFLSVLQSYQNARDVTARQMYLETMETVLKDARKVIVDPTLKGTYLPLSEMIKPPQAKKEEP